MKQEKFPIKIWNVTGGLGPYHSKYDFDRNNYTRQQQQQDRQKLQACEAAQLTRSQKRFLITSK